MNQSWTGTSTTHLMMGDIVVVPSVLDEKPVIGKSYQIWPEHPLRTWGGQVHWKGKKARFGNHVEKEEAIKQALSILDHFVNEKRERIK